MASQPIAGTAGPGLRTSDPVGPARDLAAELTELRAQLREAQETIEAIRSGEVDSLVIGAPGHEQVFTLAAADRPYRLIVEAMSEGAATVSPRGVILEANPCLGAMTGRDAGQLLGTSAADLAAEAHRAAFDRLLEVGAGDSARGELELIGPDDTTIPVQLSVSGFDLDEMLVRCLVFTDLTALHAAQRETAAAHQAVREQDAFLEQAQESVGLGWWTAEAPVGGRLTLSPAAYRICGLDPAEFDRNIQTFWRLVHPDDEPRVFEAGVAALEGFAPFRLEHRIIRPDGAPRWVLQAAVVERDDAGQPLRMLGICQDITDRKQIEEEIRAAAAYNRSLLEASLDPLVTIGPDGSITDVNIATEEMTGSSRAELLGTDFSTYFTEPELARAGYERVFRDGAARDLPLEMRHRDERITSVLYNASVYRDPSGAVLGVVAAARDITQTKRAQEALRESEGRLRALFDNAPVGIDDTGPGFEFIRVNDRFSQITGYTSDELRALRLPDIIHPADRDAVVASLRRLVSGEIGAYSVEERLLRKDGQTIWVEANRAVVRAADGASPLLVGTLRDVTEIRRAREALRESEERFRGIFEVAPVSINDATLGGEIVDANPAMCAALGYTEDELCSLQLQDIIHPDDVTASLPQLERLWSGEIDSYSAVTRYRRKDGAVLWYDVSRAVVRDSDGHPLQFVAVGRDITVQHQAEAEVRGLNSQLEARVGQRTAELEGANQNLEAFTYSVSHDLRAPLRALSGFSQALVEDYGDQLDEAGRGYTARIQAASERMATLIDDLLHLSRVSRAEMSVEPVDLTAEVGAIASDLRSREPDRRVRFAIQDDVWVSADRTLIRSVVQNLMENAWKFTGRRDDAVIEFGTTTAEGTRICCYVRDNGAGFDPAYAGKLFQPFQRLHTDAEFPGTGIGLASVRRIIERHGGRTWADGAVGQGASFYFTLDGAPDSASPG